MSTKMTIDDVREWNDRHYRYAKSSYTDLTDLCDFAIAQHEELERLRSENICDACAGTGNPVSGKPCMCRGTGKMSVAAEYLRTQLAERGVGSSDVLDVTAGQRSLGPLLADALYEKAVGVYYSSLLIGEPIFTGITKVRYDTVIRPEIERLVAEVERLTSPVGSIMGLGVNGGDPLSTFAKHNTEILRAAEEVERTSRFEGEIVSYEVYHNALLRLYQAVRAKKAGE